MTIIKNINGVDRDMTAEEIAEKKFLEVKRKGKMRLKSKQIKKLQVDLKASAKAKLIAGEPLTEEEADTIVL